MRRGRHNRLGSSRSAVTVYFRTDLVGTLDTGRERRLSGFRPLLPPWRNDNWSGWPASLETDHPGAAASVREGLADTLTLQRFGIAGALYTKLRTTNAIENFNGSITTYSRNVKRWRNGTMVVRWVSAAIVEAEKTFRRVHGWRDITRLVSALAVLEAKEEAATEQAFARSDRPKMVAFARSPRLRRLSLLFKLGCSRPSPLLVSLSTCGLLARRSFSHGRALRCSDVLVLSVVVRCFWRGSVRVFVWVCEVIMAKDEKRASVVVSPDTARLLRSAADAVGAPAVAELLRLAALEAIVMQSAYLDGLAREVDQRRRKIAKRRSSGATSAVSLVPAVAKDEKRATVVVSPDTAGVLRSAAEGIGAPTVTELLRLAALEAGAVQSAYFEGLAREVEQSRRKFAKVRASAAPADGSAAAAAADSAAPAAVSTGVASDPASSATATRSAAPGASAERTAAVLGAVSAAPAAGLASGLPSGATATRSAAPGASAAAGSAAKGGAVSAAPAAGLASDQGS